MPFQSKRLLTIVTTLITLWVPACSSDPASEVTTGNGHSQAIEVSNPTRRSRPRTGARLPLEWRVRSTATRRRSGIHVILMSSHARSSEH